MADDPNTKQRGQTENLAPTAASVEEAFKRAKDAGLLDLTSGSGFVEMPVLVTQDSKIIIKYPALCLRALGFAEAALNAGFFGEIPGADKETYIAPIRLPAGTTTREGSPGVSNRLRSVKTGRIIGKRITFQLPKPLQRAESQGKKQLVVSTRVPSSVPIIAIGVLQEYLNRKSTVTTGKIDYVYGPAMRDRYTVPQSQAEANKYIALIAKGVEIAPPA